jgi:hypothetical protein
MLGRVQRRRALRSTGSESEGGLRTFGPLGGWEALARLVCHVAASFGLLQQILEENGLSLDEDG